MFKIQNKLRKAWYKDIQVCETQLKDDSFDIATVLVKDLESEVDIIKRSVRVEFRSQFNETTVEDKIINGYIKLTSPPEYAELIEVKYFLESTAKG
jgi:hypothetical protein